MLCTGGAGRDREGPTSLQPQNSAPREDRGDWSRRCPHTAHLCVEAVPNGCHPCFPRKRATSPTRPSWRRRRANSANGKNSAAPGSTSGKACDPCYKQCNAHRAGVELFPRDISIEEKGFQRTVFKGVAEAPKPR